MVPIMLSLGAVQLNNSVDKFFALNLGAGNTTALDISWRVTNLPLGVFSVAVITVLYPLISRQAASTDIKGIKESFSLGVREIGYVMVPAINGPGYSELPHNQSFFLNIIISLPEYSNSINYTYIS